MDRAVAYARRKSIKALDEDLLSSGLLFLPGSCDRYGYWLAIFHTKANELLATRYTAADLHALIRYYYSLCYHGNDTRGLAFVVNLHNWKKDVIQILVEALDMAQDSHRGTVGVLYAIRPRTKYLQKQFKKLTGLRTSKRNPKLPLYETVCVSVPSELLRFMDIRHLTEDFGGSLKYNHKAWITFMKTMDDLEENINRTLDKLPEAHDKLSIMCQYEVPENQAEAKSLLSRIRSKYQAIMRELNFEHMIDECKDAIQALTDPYIKPEYAEIMHTPSFIDARHNLEQYKKQLIKSREELKSTWQKAESHIILMSRVIKYKKKAEQIMNWLAEVGLPSVREPAEVADCLSKAEILKTQYETGFLSIAKNVLWLSEKIQKKLDEAVLENQYLVTDILPFSRKFCESVEQFRKLVQSKYKVYRNVYDFYLTAHKLTKWYRRTLKFLPVHLLQQQTLNVGGFHDVVFHGTAAWDAAISNYLLQHPAPDPQHLIRLKNILPVIDKMNIRNQARILVHRVKVLCTLLQDCTQVKLPDMQSILRWRGQVLQGLDDITLNLNGSLLDLSIQGQISSKSQPARPLSATSMRPAPKLKSMSSDVMLNHQGQHYPLDRNIALGSRVRTSDEAMSSQSISIPHLDLAFRDYESEASESVILQSGSRGQSAVERYVSLGCLDDSGFPSSLKHVNVDELLNGQFSSNLGSLSGLDVSSSHQHLSKVLCSAEGKNSYLAPKHCQSVPNLRDHSKHQPTISMDDVLNSNLDPEEKLDIISKICLGDFKVSTELYYKIKPDLDAIKAVQQQGSVYSGASFPGTQKIQNTEREYSHRHGAPMLTSQPDAKHHYKHQVKGQSSDTIHDQPQNANKEVSKQPALCNKESVYRNNVHTFPKAKLKSTTSDPQSVSTCADAPQKLLCHNMKDEQVTVSGRKKPYKKSSIKVEEWMRRPEHQLKMSCPQQGQRLKGTPADIMLSRKEEESVGTGNSFPTLPLVRTEDLHPESSLADTDAGRADSEIIDKQLVELSLEKVDLDQSEVEASLLTTEQILEELKEYDHDLAASPTSLSSSGTLLNEDRVLATEVTEQNCPLVNVERANSPMERDGLEPQHEGSLSEESGVYTQSTDSRLRICADPTYAGSSFSVNCIQPMSSKAERGSFADCSPKYAESLSAACLLVSKEASLGDSSSQATVMTEICRKQSQSSDGSKPGIHKGAEEQINVPQADKSQQSNTNDCGDLGNTCDTYDLDLGCSLPSDPCSTSLEEDSMLTSVEGEGHAANMHYSEHSYVSYADDDSDEDFGGGCYHDESCVAPFANSSTSFSCLNTEALGLKTPVIFDIGSSLIKCGLASQSRPSVVFPTVVGREKYEKVMGYKHQDVYVGDAAQTMRGVLKLSYPLSHGTITDWNDMEKIWAHAFYDQLRISPSEHPVMLTEAPLSPRANREHMLEIMFDIFQVPALYIAPEPVLSLYATGRTTGVVLDCGDGYSHAVPIYEGHVMSHAVERVNLAGRDITQYLAVLLQEQGYNLKTSAELEIVRDIKEKFCFVAEDPVAELQKAETSAIEEVHYTLPDGHQVSLSSERFRCCEILFNPSLIGRDHAGLPGYLQKAVTKCDADIYPALLQNVVLSGGTTLLDGFKSRLTKELRSCLNARWVEHLTVVNPEHQQHLIWKGGTVLAQTPSFSAAWVFREEFDEFGFEIVHRKCF